uniref:Kinesin family member 13B n=1 Tax=Nothobranchius furzeri TaxID=105023 RepID=A0A8C6LWC5_NOTFU
TYDSSPDVPGIRWTNAASSDWLLGDSDCVVFASQVFAYDYCFWSMDESQKDKFAGQDVVFQCLGESLLDNAFMGYNACSGKSYTMMGSAEQPGLIPRLCSSLFTRTAVEAREAETFTVEVSFMEIYNEKVRDLLDPKGSRQALRVREHNVLGPYVDGLSRLAVTSYKDIESLMSEGNKSRTVAATNMNEESSRSHAVFNIILTHTLRDLKSGTSGEKVSKLSLVDLAGSERAAKTGAAGDQLKEGSNINKSLSTLGLVISALADRGAGKNKSKFVPYRDSVLTWLLKDSLGGNSRTAMVATISPAADNYDETLSTLRYADRAKSIVNHAVVNEDPNARIIRELREEVEKLREQLTEAESMKAPELKERLEESEKLIQEMTVSWEEKLHKTEAIAQERQKQLESLGISLQSSGIRVVDDKCFLVNLNADPALNELLVYYLKEHTRVGSADSQDIQLCGMAIQAEHCVLDITENNRVLLSPHRGARTCVNGSAVSSPVQLHHGDRILWGNNHFFRINLPRQKPRAAAEDEDAGSAMKKSRSSDQLEVDLDAASDISSELSFSYEFAQAEVMMKGMGINDPLQSVLQTLERQHEEEKRCALERQRLMYEQELQQLRQRLTPEKTSHLLDSSGLPDRRVCLWCREAMMTRSLRRLKEQIVRAKLLAQEASFIADELNKRTEYLVSLQIPAANLDANRKRDVALSEPAIQVRRRGKGKQIWSLEKLENRLVDMRELYQEWRDLDEDDPMMRSYFKRADPFFDEQENHSLIGVANVFLACLFHDVKLQYAVPIINQKGEVAGRLHVEVWRGTETSEFESTGHLDTELVDTGGENQERKLDCVVKILQATGLPRHLSNFVFCQYHFWGLEEPVFTAPEVVSSSPSSDSRDPQCTVVFDSAKELSCPVSEDLMEFLAGGAIAIEVYGHKQANHRRNLALWDLGVIQAKTRSLRERWSEVTRRLELWVQLMELNDSGEFTSVEVLSAKDVPTGGIFQLRQGQSHRVRVEVRPVPDSGTMPLIVSSILSVSIGDVKVHQTRPKHAPRSVSPLPPQRSSVSEDDVERESQLLECRLTLTEERNAVLVPSAGSGIPGAPGERNPVPGMETHVPVLFLDLRHHTSHISPSLEASWDSTVHGCAQLSRAASQDQKVYLTVLTVVQLSHPAHMQLVLRKRICVSVTGRQGFAQSLLKRMSQRSTIPGCGVTFEIVSNIPGDIHGPEDREVLARLAASAEDDPSADSEAAIERYLRSVLAVENVLTLDRLRQSEDSKVLYTVARHSSMHTLMVMSYVVATAASGLPGRGAIRPDHHQQDWSGVLFHSRRVFCPQVPLGEIIPPNVRSEVPRSVPHPPPISPEMEDFTPSPVCSTLSETSSTSRSTVKLSEVYTLSWDLPPQEDSEAEDFEPLPEEEKDEGRTESSADQSEDPESSVGQEAESERTDEEFLKQNQNSALHSPREQPASETSDPSRSPTPPTDQVHPVPPSSSSTNATLDVPQVKVQSSKLAPSAAANPFKIQKVKSSDLWSFQQIVGEEGSKPPHVDRAGSLGPGLNVSVPKERLEVISDSEEGGGAAFPVLPDWLRVGEFVTVGSNKSGTVRYVGPTDFADGTWVGVELEVPAGKNDGSVDGKHYFRCNPGYGVLVRPDRVTRGGTRRRRQQQKQRSGNLSGSSPNLAALTALAKGEAGASGRGRGENRKSWNT